MTFDLKTHLAQIREGRAELSLKRVDLDNELEVIENTAANLKEAIANIDEQLIEIDELDLDKVLGPAPQRMSGVLQLVEEVVNDLFSANGTEATLSEEAITGLVAERAPMAKESSVRSSLGRLVEKGVLARGGKRGSRTYSKSTGESGPPEPVKPSDEARAEILKKLTTAGADGLARKELAWDLGDAAVLDAILAEPEVEVFQREAGGVVESRYRIKEGSLGQRPLFENAAPPPAHANKD